MWLVRGVRSSIAVSGLAAGALAGLSALTALPAGLSPILVGIGAGLGMGVANEGRDGGRAGVSAAVVGMLASVGGFMGWSALKGQLRSFNPFQAVVDMGPFGVMALVVGACAAWWLGGRQTLASSALGRRGMVRRMSNALEGPLAALSREVDQRRQDRRAA
jgi:hypothetical protein